MTPENEKRIFVAYSAVRLFGLAVFFLGVAIAFTGLIRPGGWPLVGSIIAIAGVIDAVIAPRLVRKAMEQEIERKK